MHIIKRPCELIIGGRRLMRGKLKAVAAAWIFVHCEYKSSIRIIEYGGGL
jgi:hypothetical protein